MIEKELLSIRAYARKCGVNEAAVRKAIKSGNIKDGYDPVLKKIDPEIADKEYGFDVSIKKINEKIKESISQKDLEMYSGVEILDVQILPDDTKNEADRKQKIIKAQLDLLKLKTLSKELINKEDAYKEMFAFGKEVRMAMQAIPDRIVDNLITMNRNDAHRLLTESINEALTKLTNAD